MKKEAGPINGGLAAGFESFPFSCSTCCNSIEERKGQNLTVVWKWNSLEKSKTKSQAKTGSLERHL